MERTPQALGGAARGGRPRVGSPGRAPRDSGGRTRGAGTPRVTGTHPSSRPGTGTTTTTTPGRGDTARRSRPGCPGGTSPGRARGPPGRARGAVPPPSRRGPSTPPRSSRGATTARSPGHGIPGGTSPGRDGRTNRPGGGRRPRRHPGRTRGTAPPRDRGTGRRPSSRFRSSRRGAVLPRRPRRPAPGRGSSTTRSSRSTTRS
mmetsp:Transcript_36972/g.83091  ORF Transcript_36972/g.83091 Transcript_36972/m.83091 type:complete len:203 (+) Transcript_36972:378-986(+)